MDEQTEAQSSNLIELAADLVSAYISNNNVPVSELPKLIASVHAALSGVGKEAPAEPAGPGKPTPAEIKRSITPDALISFVDGKRYKTLKRHLSGHGLTMEGYRSRYGLPSDYPSTSATYSAQRSELARSLGLGQKMREATSKATSLDEMFAKAPKTRGRPRKAADESVEAHDAAPKARGRKKAEKATETA